MGSTSRKGSEQMVDNTYVRIANNFLHDMATGTWAACLLVLFVLESRAQQIGEKAALSALAAAGQTVFLFMLAALAVIAVTGTLRLFYWDDEVSADAVDATRRVLIFKHLAFFAIYGSGTWWGWSLLQAI